MRKATLLLIFLLVVFMAVPAFAAHFGFGMGTTQGSITPGTLGVAQGGTLAGTVAVDPGMVATTATTNLGAAYGWIGSPTTGNVAGTQALSDANVDTSASTGSGFVAGGSLGATNAVAFSNGTSGPAISHVGWGFGVNF